MHFFQDEKKLFVGVLLIYYEKYAYKALVEFIGLMDMISDGNEIVVVVNNLSIEKKIVNIVDTINLDRKMPLNVILGDNSVREFSGWQVALDLYNDSVYKAVVFANDTFVHHRVFNWWSKRSYSRCIQDIGFLSYPIACGNMMGAPRKISLGGAEICKWISTSIFALNYFAIEKLGKRIHPDLQELHALVPGSANEQTFFSSLLDKSMREHLIGWLFRPDNNSSWYGSSILTNSNSLAMKEKSMCILSEKWLASKMILHGVQMRDPIENYPNKIIGKILRRIFKL